MWQVVPFYLRSGIAYIRKWKPTGNEGASPRPMWWESIPGRGVGECEAWMRGMNSAWSRVGRKPRVVGAEALQKKYWQTRQVSSLWPDLTVLRPRWRFWFLFWATRVLYAKEGRDLICLFKTSTNVTLWTTAFTWNFTLARVTTNHLLIWFAF